MYKLNLLIARAYRGLYRLFIDKAQFAPVDSSALVGPRPLVIAGLLAGSLSAQVSATPNDRVYISATGSGSVGSESLSYTDDDIIRYDLVTGSWEMFFDGSDVGVGSDINALELLDDGSLLISFTGEQAIEGIGLVDDSDIVRFIPTLLGPETSGVFELYFDGSDVELSSSAENISALTMLPNGNIVVSVTGNFRAGGVSGSDEDLFEFAPQQLGVDTLGVWSIYLDGSDIQLTNSTEDLSAVWINSGEIHFSTFGAFDSSGVLGGREDIARCDAISLGESTECQTSLTLIGDDIGFSGNIDALSFGIVSLDTNNHAPIAINDYYLVGFETTLVVDVASGVLANDSDRDSDLLSAAVEVEPTNGILSLDSDGSFDYTPDPGFSGEDTFSYVVNDGTENSIEATVTLSVGEPENTAPVVIVDTYSTDYETVLTVDAAQGVLANDSDGDSDTLTAVIETTPTNGTVVLKSDGSFVYTPNENFSGDDTFSYVANDGIEASIEATVTVSVGEPGNTAPVVIADTYSTDYETVLTVDAAQGVFGQ